MKTAVKPDLKSKPFLRSKNHTSLSEKEIGVFDLKFYQKSFIVLISLSIFLIFPESPRELENICETYNSSRLCSIW